MIQPTELQAARDTLQRAIFSGARRVQFTDRSVEYNSVDDMRKALARISHRTGPVSKGGESK